MKIRSQLLLSNALIVGLFLVVVATSYVNMRTLVSSADWVAHTHEVMNDAHRLTKAMVDMETGQRGFMLTGNTSFLEPFNDGKREFLDAHRDAVELVSDNPEQTDRLQRAKELYNQWLNDAGEREIELKKMVDRGEISPEVIAHVLQGRTMTGEPLPRGEKTGKQVMDEIRILIDEIVTVEENLLVARKQENLVAVEVSETVTVWGSLLAMLLALALGLLLTRRLVGQLGAEPNELREISEDVAVGILSRMLPEQTSGGQRNVATSINRIIEAFRETALQADAIALGDLTIDIEPRGDEDQLGLALQGMTNTLRGVVSQANLIAEGDYSQQIEVKGKNDELGMALNTMAENLKRTSEENERAQWLKNGQAEAAVAMRGDKDLASLSSSIVTFLGRYLEVPVGAMYVTNGTSALKLMGSFGLNHRKHQGEAIEPGSGVLGQAVLEQKTMVVSGIPENYISITSGLGKDSATQARAPSPTMGSSWGPWSLAPSYPLPSFNGNSSTRFATPLPSLSLPPKMLRPPMCSSEKRSGNQKSSRLSRKRWPYRTKNSGHKPMP